MERILGEAHNCFSNKDEAKSLVEEKVSDSKCRERMRYFV